jgi:hypothetical protein
VVKHRTALVTAASVAGVLLAGAAAIGANIGILGSNDDEFGQLSVAAVPNVAPAGSDGDDHSGTTRAAPHTTTTVDGVATLVWAVEDGGASIVSVTPESGWTWHEQHADGSQERLRFQRNDEQLDVIGWVEDGEIDTRTEVPPGAAATDDDDDGHHGGEDPPTPDGRVDQGGLRHDEHEYDGWDDDD